MRKLLTALVIVANLVFPIRFGLPQLHDLTSFHFHGRRVELATRIKQADRFAELYAKKHSMLVIGSDKKHIRRTLHTKNDAFSLPNPAYHGFNDAGDWAKFISRSIPFYHTTTPNALLRAPPSVLQ